MVKKTNTRIMITLTKEAAKLIKNRGGTKYIVQCLAKEICDHDTPSVYELEQCGLYKEGKEVYERIALHKKGYEWYERLFPEVYKNEK